MANDPLSNSDLICKVQNTIDYLKLCGDHKNPTGEGVPVDITIMPDFVVDVDGASIHILNKSEGKSRGHIAAAEIGSRAGRVLSILAHLRDEDDEGFRLNYIAKTGSIGRAVLQERLQWDLRKRQLEEVRFPYLVPAKQTRFAILGRKTHRARIIRHIVESLKENLLDKTELDRHFYNPLQTVLDANSLYFATDNMKQFIKLIDVAVHGANPPKTGIGFRFVFVDLAAIHLGEAEERPKTWKTPHAIPGAVSLIKAKRHLQGNFEERTALIVPINEPEQGITSQVLEILYNHDLKLRPGKDVIVVYRNLPRKRGEKLLPEIANRKSAFWSDNNTNEDCRNDILCYDGLNHSEKAHIGLDPNLPDARDAFLSGMILHRAVASAWSTIPRSRDRLVFDIDEEGKWTKGLFPNPFAGEPRRTRYWTDVEEEWNFLTANWPLSEAVQFGQALALLWKGKSLEVVPDRRALLVANTNKSEIELDEAKPRDWVKVLILKEAEHFGKGIHSEGLSEFINQLRHIIQDPTVNKKKKQDTFLEQPFHLTEQTSVLKLNSWKTVQFMVALRTLRRLPIKESELFFCPKKDDEKNAAYLTDLDGTLLNSGGFRSLCYKNAFLSLLFGQRRDEDIDSQFPILPELNIGGSDYSSSLEVLEAIYELYNAFVYKQWEYWERILRNYPYSKHSGYPMDFRQVWNHRLSYSVFLWALLKACNSDLSKLPKSPITIFQKALKHSQLKALLKDEEIQGGGTKNRIEKCKALLKGWLGIENITDFPSQGDFEKKHRDEDEEVERIAIAVKECYREIANIDTKYTRYIGEANKRFWKVEYEPIRHTRECLRTLRDVLGVRLYVATEGHHETQLEKIRAIRLDRFFPDMTVMSTEAAASTHEDLRNIKDELQQKEESIKSLDRFEDSVRKSQEEKLKKAFAYSTNLRDLKEVKSILDEGEAFEEQWKPKLESIRESLKEEVKHLELFQEQWETFANKTPGYIYPLIVASILVDSDVPFVGLTDLGLLVNKIENVSENISKTCFAMVGDRESKDIKPIIRSCGSESSGSARVATVRLLSWDHKKEDLNWDEDKKSWEFDEKNDRPVPPQAQYVAWTPNQALLCLSRKEAWNEHLDYHTIPAVIPGRLAYSEGKQVNINSDLLDALAWGLEKHGTLLEQSMYLISFLVLRNSIRDESVDGKGLIDSLNRIKNRSVQEQKWERYHFVFSALNHFRFETLHMSEFKQIPIARAIRDSILHEFDVDFGTSSNPKHRNCCGDALKIIRGLAKDNPPQCEPSDSSQQIKILSYIPDHNEKRQMRKDFLEWKRNWKKRTNAG